jgi:hypothetical protein
MCMQRPSASVGMEDCGRKMGQRGAQKDQKKPANSPNQRFYKVEYTLLDGSVKLVPLCGIHCCPGMWTARTTTPVITFWM